MAKGNLFQGMARGKVGDVVFSRLDGQQISRVRNRNPKNPRTNAQLYQRAIMATVMAAYSYGKEIFDHSFEGYSVGAGCQRRFISENTKKMRSTIAEYLNSETSMATEGPRVTAPGLSVCVPNALTIAEGSLVNNVVTYAYSNQNLRISFPEPIWEDPQDEESQTETIGEYLSRNGMKAADIFTCVWICNDPKDVLYQINPLYVDDYTKLFRGHFGWMRFIVRGDLDLTKSLNTIGNFKDLFIIESGGDAAPFNEEIITGGGIEFDFYEISRTEAFASGTDHGFAFGVIRSRDNEKLRSNASLTVYGNEFFGIVPTDIPDVWKKGTVQLGNSDLILEGGE